MKNTNKNMGSFTTVKLQAINLWLIAIIALVAVIGFGLLACDGSDGDDDSGNNGVVTLLDGGTNLQGQWQIGSSHLWNLTSAADMYVGDIGPLTYVQKHASDNSYEVIIISWKSDGELWETVTYTVTDAQNIVITGAVNANPERDTAFRNCIGKTVTWYKKS